MKTDYSGYGTKKHITKVKTKYLFDFKLAYYMGNSQKGIRISHNIILTLCLLYASDNTVQGTGSSHCSVGPVWQPTNIEKLRQNMTKQEVSF